MGKKQQQEPCFAFGNVPSLQRTATAVPAAAAAAVVGGIGRRSHPAAPAARSGPSDSAQPKPNTISRQVAGLVMHKVNQEGNTKRQPGYKQVKACVNEAVQAVFGAKGHVQVQPQGSVAKGTALPSSDWDFFLRMDNTVATATQAQRSRLGVLLAAGLERRGIEYHVQLHSNRIRMSNGCTRGDNGQVTALPDVDVLSQRFKTDVRLEPNSRALANSHVRQQVVKELKSMPGRFNNLQPPKSYRVEEFARLVEDEVCRGSAQAGGKAPLVGADGFAELLGACLEKIGGVGMTAGQQEQLLESGMGNTDWKHAAKKHLKELTKA